jgi:hypothetical protein
MLKCSDIISFTQKSLLRGKNDQNNKLRETILSNLLTLPEKFLEDPTYGSQWQHLQDQWKTSLESLSMMPYDRLEVEPKGGRGYHYDFLVRYFKTYSDSNVVMNEIKIEFKHHCQTINRLPQFLSLSTKSGFFPTDYADYYYDNYLTKYINLDPSLTEMPSKEEYLKYVHTTQYDRLPLFRQMYDHESTNKKEKHKLVNESIKTYLETYIKTIHLETIQTKIKESQMYKHYFLWDLQRFHIDEFKEEDFSNLIFVEIKNNNVIVLKTDTSIFHLLLRWRNHKGILMPAWQISLKNRNHLL